MVDVTEWCGEGPADEVPSSVALWGRLSARKGIETLLEAAQYVSGRVPGLRVVIAGSSVEDYIVPPLPELEQDGRVDVRLGHLSNSELCDMLRSSTVTVAPYVDAMQSSVVLTSFAFGCPIVASDTGGLREQVIDGVTGWLVPPGDAWALADTLARVLSDPQVVATARAEVSKRWSYEESWAVFGDVSVEAYRSLLK
jgi:glycosyltransferase involved in cell wall biosynthesis